MSNNPNKLNQKIEELSTLFDIHAVLKTKTNIPAVARYYNVNKLTYTLFHNRDDFVHMGISRDGIYKKEDLLEQAKVIERYIMKLKTTKVLELATGRGATSAYLARNYPSISFEGLDLPNGQLSYAKTKTKNLYNFRVHEGDYHNLQQYPKDSYDIVFIIEALCHSNNKQKVIKEVKRILKKEGVFIIIDGFSGKPISKFKTDELLALQLIEKGMRVHRFENYEKFQYILDKNGFKVIFLEDASLFIMPTLKRFEATSKFLMSLPRLLSKSIITLFPTEFTYNAISGYLLPIAIELEIAKYMIVVAKKR